MYLAEVEGLSEGLESGSSALRAAIEEWQEFPASDLADHAAPCCAIAREWLAATDCSHMPHTEPLTGPRWLRQRVTWGPSIWPLYWCEAVEAKTLDCGALAALARQVFQSRGVSCHTAQFIQKYTKGDGQHWYRTWQRKQAEVHWIQDDLVYHEACAVVVRDNQIRIWDPTASWWVEPRQREGYSAVLATRILSPQTNLPHHFDWDGNRLIPNQWQPLERGPTVSS
jgi:hypothetical protein